MYNCPYLNKKFNSKCPINKCHANIDFHDSGCIHNINPDIELTVESIAIITNTDKEYINDKYIAGINNIQTLLKFKKLLDEVRLKNYNHCDKCGMIIYKDKCDDNCSFRYKLNEVILETFPFNISELKIDNKDICKLIINNVNIKILGLNPYIKFLYTTQED